MPSNKRKSETVEVLAGGSCKKSKLPVRDPFAGKYAEMVLEIFNTQLNEICDNLFNKLEKPCRFEIKSYKYEISGVNKTVCGESCFLEESKATLIITYEKEKKDDMIELVTGRFPSCVYSFK